MGHERPIPSNRAMSAVIPIATERATYRLGGMPVASRLVAPLVNAQGERFAMFCLPSPWRRDERGTSRLRLAGDWTDGWHRWQRLNPIRASRLDHCRLST